MNLIILLSLAFIDKVKLIKTPPAPQATVMKFSSTLNGPELSM